MNILMVFRMRNHY